MIDIFTDCAFKANVEDRANSSDSPLAPVPKLPTAGYCPSLSGMCETLGESARRERLLLEALAWMMNPHTRTPNAIKLGDSWVLYCWRKYDDGVRDEYWYACGKRFETPIEAIEAALCAAAEGEGANDG